RAISSPMPFRHPSVMRIKRRNQDGRRTLFAAALLHRLPRGNGLLLVYPGEEPRGGFCSENVVWRGACALFLAVSAKRLLARWDDRAASRGRGYRVGAGL